MTLCSRGRSVFSRTLVRGLAMSLIGRATPGPVWLDKQIKPFFWPELPADPSRIVATANGRKGCDHERPDERKHGVCHLYRRSPGKSLGSADVERIHHAIFIRPFGRIRLP